MTLDGISSSIPTSAKTNSFTVKVSEGQEDQQEKVVGEILESVEQTSPSRELFDSGKSLNVKA